MTATAWANAVLLSVCAGLCIGCAVYALLLAHLRRQTRSRIEAMLPSHEGLTSAATSLETAKASATGPSKAVEEWVRYRLLASRRGRQLLVTYQLARSGSASLWPLINIALLATLGFLLLLLLTRNLIGAVLVSAAALGAAYWRLLQVPAQKRLDQIRVALPEALAGMSNALRSGATIVPALEQAAKDAESPLKEELEQVVANVSIGQDLRTALSAMRARVPLEELDNLSAALLIQQRSGGDLPEMLGTTAALVQESVRLKNELRIQTQEGRQTGLVVGLLPVLVLGLLFFVSRQYLDPLLNNPIGRLVLGMSLGALVLGFVLIRRTVNVKI